MALKSLKCLQLFNGTKNNVCRYVLQTASQTVTDQGILQTAFGVTCIAAIRGKGIYFLKKYKHMDKTRLAGWKKEDMQPKVTSHNPIDYIEPVKLEQEWEDSRQNRAGNRDGPVRNYIPPKQYEEMQFPPRRKLPIVPKTPMMVAGANVQPTKMVKKIVDMRGPELIHNKLKFKQFGIQATQGGAMKFGHFEMCRYGINRKMDEDRMFAVWRVDPPWKAISKKGIGHRMGGGKSGIDHYVTPVKRDRIILEFGGYCEWEEVSPILSKVAEKLPFQARVVTQEMLEEEARRIVEFEKSNINPFTFEYALKKNMLGSQTWASKYDFIWFNKYR